VQDAIRPLRTSSEAISFPVVMTPITAFVTATATRPDAVTAFFKHPQLMGMKRKLFQ
jgi:hypothetical protein